MTDTGRKVELTLMGINAPQAELIRCACPDATGPIRLSQLDKGLRAAQASCSPSGRCGPISPPHDMSSSSAKYRSCGGKSSKPKS